MTLQSMTWIIARKTITVVFGTTALQLIEVLQCGVIIFIETNKLVFLPVAMLSLISLSVTAALYLKLTKNYFENCLLSPEFSKYLDRCLLLIFIFTTITLLQIIQLSPA